MDSNQAAIELNESLLDDLSQITDEVSRARILSQHRLDSPAIVKQLHDASRTKLRVAPRQSLALAEAAIAIANSLGRDDLLGPGLRAKANALYVLGDNQSSLQCHDQAVAIFRRQGNLEEQARTLNASIQPNILLGSYERAMEAATAARDLFARLGDTRRLAHVEINLGNLYHRQDRFEELFPLRPRLRNFPAFCRFRRATRHCPLQHVGLSDQPERFPRALATYRRAREMFVAHGMTLLIGQADYNIAYLYYLRGEYGRAIAMLRAAREQSELNGDAHILALCYLDLSDIYLGTRAEFRGSRNRARRYSALPQAWDGLRRGQMPGQ